MSTSRCAATGPRRGHRNPDPGGLRGAGAQEAGLASLMILLLLFVPVAFLITIPSAIEIVTRGQASARVQSCATMAANGLRTWVNITYRRDRLPPATLSQLSSIAAQVYGSTMCGSPGSVGLGAWTIQQIAEPAAGVYTVTVRQDYVSPYGAGWFRSTRWTVTGTSFWYSHDGQVPQR